MDLESARNLAAPKCQDKPGMRYAIAPTEAASLEFVESVGSTTACRGNEQQDPVQARDAVASGQRTTPLLPGTLFQSIVKEMRISNTGDGKYESTQSLGVAYDNLHRIHAILAYLHIMRHSVSGIGQFLDEAKHTYEQSLERFAVSDFNEAKEFAEASWNLSLVVEIIMTRALRSDDSLGSMVPPPPEYPDTVPEPEHIEEDLAQAETVLSRIHWLLEFGTLPAEERAQVRKLASWGETLYKQAMQTYRETVLEDAAEFARAALAGANSAEHICRKWYVGHPVQL